MADELERKQSLANKANSILEIELENLNSEKETVALYRDIHHHKIISFRDKIFKSAATAATLLTAILAFKSTDLVNEQIKNLLTQYQLGIIIILVIDIIIVFVAEYWFSRYIQNDRISWFQLEDEYISAMGYINDVKIFISSKELANDTINDHQLYLLVEYTRWNLRKYRKRIVCKINKLRKTIRLAEDIKTLLKYPSDNQERLEAKAQKIYEVHKHSFEQEKAFLDNLNEA
jgi:hypothetical protein